MASWHSDNGAEPGPEEVHAGVWFWIHGAAAWFSALALVSPHAVVRAAAMVSLLINVCAFMREA